MTKPISDYQYLQTLSIHHAAPGFFPASERAKLPDPSAPNFDPFTLSLPLKQGASDRTYARIWPIVEKIRNTFKPDYVVLQCGVDALAGDPCATFNWSLGDHIGSMGWCIQKVVNEWPGKKLLLGGGLYITLTPFARVTQVHFWSIRGI